MSKRDVNDKSTYTFMRMGAQNFSHGKITLDNKSYTEGKEIECPECKHKFIWDKFFCLSPRYPKSWYDNPEKNKNNIPYGFQVSMEINTPSKGDPLPRISYIIYGCKLTIEDRVNESRPKDGVSFRSHNKQLTMKILDMGTDDDMDKYSNCCDAPFGYPGWPDCDLCSACGEHAVPDEEESQLRVIDGAKI